MAFQAGSAYIPVRPTFVGFQKEVQAQLQEILGPVITKIGVEIGQQLGTGIKTGLGDPISGPLDDSSKKQQSKAPKQGEQVGGAFADAFSKRLRAAFESLPKAHIDADSTEADLKIADLRARMEELSKKTIGIDIDGGEALAELAAIKAELEDLSKDKRIEVRADTAAATAELSAVEAEADKLNGKNVDIDVKADTSGAVQGIGVLAASIGGLAAIPAIGVLGAGIGALAPALVAAGTGFGGLAAVAIPAISRIKAAITAQNQAQTQSTANVAQAQQRALSMAGAEQQLAQAERNEGVAHAQALQAVQSAEQQVAAAQVSARDAQISLNEARVAAKQADEDLANSITDAGFSLQQDRINVDNARLALQQLTSAQSDAIKVQQAQAALAGAKTTQAAIVADPTSTVAQRTTAGIGVDSAAAALKSAQNQQAADAIARKQAQLAYEEAIQQLKEEQLAYQRLQQQEAMAAKQGVDGSDQVRQARERLAAANQQTSNSEQALAQAQANVARVDQQSADQVASARRAVTAASLQGASANSSLAASMAKLSPAERQLMVGWQGLTTQFTAWGKSLEPAVLPIFTRSIGLVRDMLPTLTPVVRGAAGAVNGLVGDVGKAARSPFWVQFRQQMTALVPTAITGLGRAGGNVATGLAGIVKAFLPFAPAILSFIDRITAGFSRWGQGLGTSNGFASFIAYVKQAAPQLEKLITLIAKAVTNVVKSLAAFGPTSLLGLQGLARLVASLSPGEIQAIAVAFLAVKSAIVANNVAEAVSKQMGLFNLALDGGSKKAPLFYRAVVAAGKGIGSLATSVASGAKSIGTGLVGALNSSGIVTGFRNVDAAFAENASASTRAGAGIRSQISRWGQQLSAMPTKIAGAGRTAFTSLSGFASKTGTAISSGASKGSAAFGRFASGIGAGAAKAASSVGRVSASLAKAGASGIASGIAASGRAIGGVATAAATAAVNMGRLSLAYARTAITAAASVIKTIALTIATNAAKVATAAWTVITYLWDAAMDANPIGLVIIAIVALVAIVIYAYTHFSWFRTIVQGVFHALQVVISLWWNYYVKPIFTALNYFVRNILAPTIKWLWANIVKPVFNGIWATIKYVWENGIRPVFDAVRSAIGDVGNAFKAGASAIGYAWGKVAAYAAAPIRFVVNTVYNKGIVGLWNDVMGWLHLPGSLKLSTYTVPGLAAGGPLPVQPGIFNKPTAIVGEGNPAHPEYVIPTDPKYRGRAQGLWAAAGSDLQMLAGGGILGDITGEIKKIAGSVVNLGADALKLLADPKGIWDGLVKKLVPSAAGLATSPWGQAASAIPPKILGEAWTEVQQIISAFSAAYGGAGGGAMVSLANTQVGTGENPPGSNHNKYTEWFGIGDAPWCAIFIDWLASKTGQTAAIPHTASAPGMATAFGSRFKSGSSGIQAGDIAFFDEGAGSIQHTGIAVSAANGGTWTSVEGNYGDVVAKHSRSSAAGYAHPDYKGGAGGGSFPGGSLIHASPATAQAWAAQALVGHGWGGQFGDLKNLWNRESGWRWSAENPSSGAYGIPQALPASKLGNTSEGGGPDWHDNAATQMRWGLDYIDSRYGSPAAAWSHEISSGWYDNGGYLQPGLNLAYNASRKPEPVLSSQQWSDISAATQGGDGGTHYHAHLDEMTAGAYQTQIRTTFHAMEVANGNRERIGRRR